MLFDTDVLIWAQRGNGKAIDWIEKTPERFISAQSYMELLQGATSREWVRITKDFLVEGDFRVLPLTEGIGHRALIYIEEYALLSGMRAGDAIIAATATENNLVLATGNRKHFEPVQDLRLRLFKAET